MTTDVRRLEVRAQVIECVACPLGQKTTPVPFTGPTPNPVAIVGEAPGRTEAEEGRPFIGPAGQMLRDAFKEAGYRGGEPFICNSTSCYPLTEDGKGRTPKPEEVAACNTNLVVQLELCEPAYVMVLGSVALSGLRPELKITRVRGSVLLRSVGEGERIPWFLSFHPAAALRDRRRETQFYEDVKTFVRLVQGEIRWIELVPDACMFCGAYAVRWDDDGVALCGTCFPGDPDGWGKAIDARLAAEPPFRQEAMTL